MQIKIVNRFMCVAAAAALIKVCQCRMQMQHVGYVLCRALVGEKFIMLIIVLCIEDMATFTALAKNFLPKSLQYKDIWAWQNLYPAKIFMYMYTVFLLFFCRFCECWQLWAPCYHAWHWWLPGGRSFPQARFCQDCQCPVPGAVKKNKLSSSVAPWIHFSSL